MDIYWPAAATSLGYCCGKCWWCRYWCYALVACRDIVETVAVVMWLQCWWSGIFSGGTVCVSAGSLSVREQWLLHPCTALEAQHDCTTHLFRVFPIENEIIDHHLHRSLSSWRTLKFINAYTFGYFFLCRFHFSFLSVLCGAVESKFYVLVVGWNLAQHNLLFVISELTCKSCNSFSDVTWWMLPTDGILSAVAWNTWNYLWFLCKINKYLWKTAHWWHVDQTTPLMGGGSLFLPPSYDGLESTSLMTSVMYNDGGVTSMMNLVLLRWV